MLVPYIKVNTEQPARIVTLLVVKVTLSCLFQMHFDSVGHFVFEGSTPPARVAYSGMLSLVIQETSLMDQ